jgi:RNA 2',3'-cyclic 3'-phosphodiesterase
VVEALRIFAAIAPPDEVRHALVDQLGAWPIPGRLVSPVNWHITTRFLGEVDEVTVERYVAELDQMELGAGFTLSLRRFGAFPNHRKATVVWLGADRGEQRLHQLAEACDDASAAVGVTSEDRPFSPHLTISRVRPPANAVALVNEGEVDVAWRVKTLVVYESRFGRDGMRYIPLETFPLIR